MMLKTFTQTTKREKLWQGRQNGCVWVDQLQNLVSFPEKTNTICHEVDVDTMKIAPRSPACITGRGDICSENTGENQGFQV